MTHLQHSNAFGGKYPQNAVYPNPDSNQSVYANSPSLNPAQIGFQVDPNTPYAYQQQHQPPPPPYAVNAPPPGVVVDMNNQNPNVVVPSDVKHADTFMKFSERSIRMGFIRKVYAILTVQLLITFGFICVFIFTTPIKTFCVKNWWMMLVSVGAMLFSMVLSCCLKVARRSYPLNFILLLLFTLCEAFAVATVTAYFAVNEVLMAFAATMLITIGITLFTCQTKWDFSYCAVISFLVMIFVVVFGVICALYFTCGWFWHCFPDYVNAAGVYVPGYCYRSSIWFIVVCGLVVLIFSMYLVVDTQLMIGGKHREALSPEEFIFAALNLYVDIIMIFLYVLLLFGIGGGARS